MKNPIIKTGFSNQKNPVLAVKEVFEKIDQKEASLIIFFVPATYDQVKINKEFRKRIPLRTPFIGCSSVRVKVPKVRMVDNISSDGFKEGIVAMSIASDGIKASVRLMEKITDNWEKESKKALLEASKDLNIDPKNANPQKFFGLLLCDAMREREEKILENIYSRSNFLFIGGGSIGKHSLIKGVLPGWIHTHDGAFTDAAALAIVKTEIPFVIDMTTSVIPTEKIVKITKAKDRKVFEINGRPAAKEYARLLGVPKILLGTKQVGNYWLFTDHPFGLMVGERAFIRDVAFRMGDALMMGCNAREGEELYLMKRGDFVGSTKKMIKRIEGKLGNVSGMLMFQCGYRFFETFRFKKEKELFEVLNIAPIIGLSSYGEYYGWASMAQTLTVLAFGEKK